MNERIVSLRISEKDYQKLKEKSAEIGISVAALIRFSIFKNFEVIEIDNHCKCTEIHRSEVLSNVGMEE